jgi:PqqD family protein of HPr-rel-A system
MPERNVRIADDVVFEVLDDETVVLNLTSGEYHTLNGTGSRAWQLIEEHGDLDRVRAAMAAEFDATEDRIADDLDRLLGDLVERGLVTVAP